MFIELVDALRCPHDHEDSWLVLAAERMYMRNVMDGVLGCPVCRAQYPIADGVADFRLHARSAAAAAPEFPAPDADQAMRLAAFLDLRDGDGYAALVGTWTALAPAMQAVAETHLLLVNPALGVTIEPGTSGMRVDECLHMAAGSLRALAVDRGAGKDLLTHAVNIVRPGGRVVAPAELPVPEGLTELARDTAVWVAERGAATSALISLARGR
ncbi:MAG TPA: hypothetical protein VIJ16_02765 [Gemmatimonadaceae bacterium]